MDADGTLVRVVTDRDLRHYLFSPGVFRDRQYLGRCRAEGGHQRSSDSKPAISVGPDDDLESAAGFMVKHRIGSVPVVDKGRMIGIIIETDLLRRIVPACSTECEEIVVSFP